MIRVAAGFAAIACIRKQRIHDLSFQNLIRRGKSSFHLIVNNSVIFQRPLCIFKLIAPSLLAEDLFFFVNIRIKNSIQVHMHQILEILIVAACNRIAGFIRIGHCIEKCIKRTLYQLHKRIFQRKLPGTAQHAVLQNVGYAGAVFWRSTKSNIKHLVLIIILYKHDSCACFFMAQQISCGTDILQIFFFDNVISKNSVLIHICLRFLLFIIALLRLIIPAILLLPETAVHTFRGQLL